MIRRVAAATALLLGATVMTATPAAAAAATPDQVALVVDYPDGSTRSFCVDFRSGMSGADVLAVAGPSYGTGPYAGFVLQIGGKGTVPPTTSDYWAYWTTQSGSLVYSGRGVTATKPAAGSVEAWHWNSSGSQEPPSGGSYASLCPGGFAAAPTSAPPAPSTSGVAAPTRAGGGPPTAAPTSDAAGGTSPGTSGSAAGPGSSSSAPSGGATDPTSATATGSAATSAGSSAPASSVAASNLAAADDADGPGAGSVVGIVLAAVAVVGFAAATLVARRRRAERD